MTLQRSFGSIAALFAGACFVWSCAGEIGSGEPTDAPGGKGGAAGTASQPVSGAAGKAGSGSAVPPTSGAAGQAGSSSSVPPTSGAAGHPVTGAAGQAGSGNVAPPTSGAAGQAGSGNVAPPTSGAAGQAGSGNVAPPTSGAAGQAGSGNVPPPTSGAAGQAGSGSVTPPTTGAAGHPVTGAAGQAGTGAAGQAGSASSVPPTTGAAGQAGSGSTVPPTTGAAGQAGSSTTTPPPVGGAAGTTAPPATTAGATIVPLYTDPSDPSWNAIVAAKMAHPRVGVVAIVNPADGPGSSVSSAYTSGIAKLNAAGIKVIGYVATGYASKAASTIQADIDRWKTFYPGLGGIFFDEQSNQAGDVAFYKALSQYAKSQGLTYTVGNPGTDTAEGYIGALDTMLIYETDGLPSASQMGGWHSKYPTSNFGIIPYAVNMDATFVHNARQYVEYIYLQSDNLPNPWDSLPSYFADLLAALE